MASLRSISSSKTSEHLSASRVNRSSASAIGHTEKKLSITKSPSSVVSTLRQKSSRMTSKKDLFGPVTSSATIYSSRPISSTDSQDITTEQMTALKLRDSSPKRSRSKASNTTTTELPSHANSTMDKSYDEQTQ